MKILYTLILVLLAGTAYGQSNLPACQGSNFSQWHSCFGNLIDASGDKYLGEFKNGTFNGQGTYFYANGDEYVGEFKEGNKNGQGIFFFANDDKYEGEYKDDKKNGQGTYYYLANDQFKGDKYVGEYRDGKKNGQGTYYFLADNQFKGNKYVGEFKDGEFNGQGTYFYANGDVYVGEFKDGMKNGQDIFIKTDKFIAQNSVKPSAPVIRDMFQTPEKFMASNNSTVEKEQLGTAYGQSNLPACQGIDASKWDNCFGTANFAKDAKYIGEWSNGKANGKGTHYIGGNFKGNKYVGEFKDNTYHGQGTYFRVDGSIDSGLFKDGKLVTSTESPLFKDGKPVTSQNIDPNSFTRIAHGITVPNVSESQSNLPACKGGDMPRWNNCFGTSNYASGNKFVGEFKNGQHNGQGTFTYANGNKYSGEHKDGKFFGQGIFTFTNGIVQIGEWKDEKPHGRFIEYSAGKIVIRSGLFEDGKLITSQYIDPNSFTRISHSSLPLVVSDTQRFDSEQSNLQLEQERRLLSEERRRLDEEKRQREQAKTNQRINLQVNNTQPSTEGDVTITVQTNADTASLKINGEEQGGRPDGNYTLKRVARVGQETRFEIYAKDIYGNADTKTITVSRTVIDSKVSYLQLSPDRIKRQPERDAVAIIIGISNYKSLPKADYAKDDAQVFFDYAIRALGVRPGNIKLLMDEQADAEEIYTAFKTWLPARVKSTTDVYVFYSGHGLPTQDGSGLYWLPQRANRDLISKTGILLSEINNDIQASKPKSVTIFMDACYSGQARGGETLVASARPIALKSQPTTFPSNFTVISASQADQISSSSPELQHGIFSYYLMRGIEGEADLNKDGKITLDEIQAYLSENVGRQARIMNRQQEPQVIGDGSNVLVGK